VVRATQRERDSVENGAVGDQGPRVEDARLVRTARPVRTGPGNAAGSSFRSMNAGMSDQAGWGTGGAA
jgi:hypothetical protein